MNDEHIITNKKIILGVARYLKLAFGDKIKLNKIRFIPMYNFKDKTILLKFKE